MLSQSGNFVKTLINLNSDPMKTISHIMALLQLWIALTIHTYAPTRCPACKCWLQQGNCPVCRMKFNP